MKALINDVIAVFTRKAHGPVIIKSDLTEEEKAILRLFIVGKTSSVNLSIKNGVVLGLQQKKIIIKLGIVGTDALRMSFPFNIQPWAWEYFNKNPQLIDI